MNIEEVEEAKKYENYHAKPVSDPFKTIADHRKVRELSRKMKVEEVEDYENSHTKPVHAGRGHPESTKIHIQNEHASTKAGK